MTSPNFADCIPSPPKEDPESVDSEMSDFLSSDSDDSTLDQFAKQLEKQEEGKPEKQKKTEREKELERMFFYSIYVDHQPPKDRITVDTQASEGFDTPQEYDQPTRKAIFAEASKFVIDEIDEEKFKELLKTEVNEDEGIEDIEGNMSIKTLTEKNFNKLRMDGPSRRIALLFSLEEPGDRPISHSFLHFMQSQKEKYPFISGVLLYYPTAGLGIHIIEGSEYILLMHFPAFFKSECFKKIIKCKVLAVEDLSAMKYFEHYSCYKATPPKFCGDLPEREQDPNKSLIYIQQIGAGLNVFLKHVYRDFPSVTDDNDLPPSIETLLPSAELLDFALQDNRWKPGLREVKHWYHHILSVPGETDNSEFVWPLRSDLFPVHLFRPGPGEEEFLIRDLTHKIVEEKWAQLGGGSQSTMNTGKV